MCDPDATIHGPAVIRVYMFALEPTTIQVEAFQSHCGAQRFAYNWALARVRANWAQRSAEQTYGLTDDQLTPWVESSAYSLRNAWNHTKASIAPWWAQNSKETYASGCENLATALKNFKAGRAHMPQYKSKNRTRLSCRFSSGSAIGLGADRRHVKLPRIGAVRTGESTRKLARKVDAGLARIRSATLSYQRGRWHVSFSVEVPDLEPAQRTNNRVVGIDLGITHLAVLSTGERVPNPRHLDTVLRRLRRAQRACSRRKGPDRRTCQTPSQRWHKARGHVQRIHMRVANLRRNNTHQLTTYLVSSFDTIVIEGLAVSNMIRNRHLARHIANASWAEIRRQLTYKADRAGVRLIVADRWFASSKTCSGCGSAKTKLGLSERTYSCTTCGLTLDRDLNAAKNLAALAVDTGELRREQPDGSNVRPGVFARSAVALPREDRISGQRHHRKVVAR